MKIIFPHDPVNEDSPDPVYLEEVAAATRAGIDFMFIDYRALADHNNAARAVREIPVSDAIETAIYRGWSLRAEQYAALYDALLSRGLRLINNAAAYRHTHHLPESLHIIKDHTPKTVWVETDGSVNNGVLMQLLATFNGAPLILKDFVRSQKHYWWQACYISSASDETAVRNTVDTFLHLQGKSFVGGLVFREYVELAPLTTHPRSGMPLAKEYRIFYLYGQPIMTVRYWDVPDYDEQDRPPVAQFDGLARSINSHFFTMDIAQKTDGTWIIIELGDGQVARLPQDASRDAFYKMLKSVR